MIVSERCVAGLDRQNYAMKGGLARFRTLHERCDVMCAKEKQIKAVCDEK